MNLLFLLLGVIDTLAAILVVFPFSEVLMPYIMVYMLAKGGYFLFSLISTKNSSPLFAALSAVDIMTGTILGTMVLGFRNDLFTTLGFVSLIKGLYATISPTLS